MIQNTFLDNQFSRWYFALIESRQGMHRPDTYLEKHHIIPRSLGGSESRDNIVQLSPREHFIAHLLLTRMCEGADLRRMQFALNMMLVKSPDHGTVRYTPCSIIYDRARRDVANAVSVANTGKIPWNKGKPRTDAVKNAISMANKGRTAWNKGVKRTEEERINMSEGCKRSYEAGRVSHNKGMKLGDRLSEEGRATLIEKAKQRVPWNKGLKYKNRKNR